MDVYANPGVRKKGYPQITQMFLVISRYRYRQGLVNVSMAHCRV